MLDSIIRLSLRYRSLVLISSLVILVYGSYLTTTMSIDVFPDLDRPRVVIITEAPGLATEEVETLVTQPIEIALMGAKRSPGSTQPNNSRLECSVRRIRLVNRYTCGSPKR